MRELAFAVSTDLFIDKCADDQCKNMRNKAFTLVCQGCLKHLPDILVP